MTPGTTAAPTGRELAGHWAEAFACDRLPTGPAWLDQLRLSAAEEFRSQGLPGNKDEAWKYTSLLPLERLAPELTAVVAAEAAVNAQFLPEERQAFGFRLAGSELTRLPHAAPAGVTVLTLEAALQSTLLPGLAPRLRNLLEAIDTRGRARAFQALNTALLGEALVIHVAAGVEAGLCSARWQPGAVMTPRLVNFRLLLVLEEGAQLDLLERFESAGAGVTAAGQSLNLVLQAQLGAGARLRHLRVQDRGEQDVLLTYSQLQQSERSQYAYAGFDLGGGMVRHDIVCRLEGAGAGANLSGAFVLDGECQAGNHVRVDHLAADCRSEQFFRGVLGGRSRGVFNGKVVIHAGADGAKVRESNANLLLSPLAEIDTKPEFEIHADEVEASHGATVGQLDESAVFYLRSRGIPEADARGLLTMAFCREAVARIPLAGFTAAVGSLVEGRMPAGGR